jgi:hypothetical protein
MTDYNWHTFSDKELAAFIRNGGLTAGYDTDFSHAMVEETASRLEAAEAALAAEKEVRLKNMQGWTDCAIKLVAMTTERDELALKSEQAKRDLAEYRAEIERLTKKAMTS